MKELAWSYIWWPNLDQDIEKLVASCEKCNMHMVLSMSQLHITGGNILVPHGTELI